MTNSNLNANSKYQLLKQKKLELEKRLNEKYNQLQQVCREVSTQGSATDPSSLNFLSCDVEECQLHISNFH